MRGGKREGAGAKRLLDAWQRIEIGVECDRLAEEYAFADMKSKIGSKYDPTDSAMSLKIISKVPANLRDPAGKTARQVAYELSLGKVPETGYPEVILEAARHLRDRRETLDGVGSDGPEPVGRYSHVRRAYGHRQQIISEVAAWASEKFCRVVSPRQIESCWKGYRRFLTTGQW